ncbi:hypothetical protein KC957_01265, partial [Candidatus Saccharibacteria bacterium]|nr:hypothetical protein [Candidatus Saccharibacteria bacterium]
MEQKPKPSDSKSFVPPEEAAAQDQSHPHLDDELAATGQKPKPTKKKRLHLTKKQWINVGIAGVIILIGGSYLAWKLL